MNDRLIDSLIVLNAVSSIYQPLNGGNKQKKQKQKQNKKNKKKNKNQEKQQKKNKQ